jgi:hypothetical protein
VAAHTDASSMRYYLKVDHGYIVLFDPKTKVGKLCKPRKHVAEGKEILIFSIAIGR